MHAWRNLHNKMWRKINQFMFKEKAKNLYIYAYATLPSELQTYPVSW